MIVSLGLGDKIIFEFGSKGKKRVNYLWSWGPKRIYILAQWVSPWDIRVLQELRGDTKTHFSLRLLTISSIPSLALVLEAVVLVGVGQSD